MTGEPRTCGAPQVAVIYNPASGSSVSTDDLRTAVSAVIPSESVRWLPTSENDPGIGMAADAVASGATTVVACGGDGTVRAVIQGMAGSSAALGVVPLGTGNLLAGNLEIPSGLDAVQSAFNGEPTVIDVGVLRAGGGEAERFAVMAGMGFDARMIRDTNSTTKRRFGVVAYVIAAVRNLPAKVVHAAVEVDGTRVWDGRTVMVLVGNCSAISGGVEMFPDGRPDDGRLDVAVVAPRGVRQWVSVAWRLLRGLPQRPDRFCRATGTAVRITTAHPTVYELDGEDRPPARELTITVEPGALRVRRPAT